MTEPLNAIAVVGMNCRFPGADSPEEFWRNLRDGVESVSTFDPAELRAAGVDPTLLDNPNFVPRGGVIDGLDRFDAGYFGYSPREAELIDPQQRLFLECAVGALERAGCDPQRFDGLIGLYGGVGLSSYMWNNIYPNQARLADVSQMQMLLSVDKDYLATRVSYKLDLRGPSVTVQCACSTSMVAIHLACQALLTGECDLALAGGASLILPEVRGYVYEEGGVLSPDGHCRSFDADAKGTVPGSGVGLVVLKRLDDALADRDTIHALVCGSAMNNDGAAKVGYTAPSTRGQAQVIIDAITAADVPPETIGHIETHGAATPLGDPIEITALTDAFRALGGVTDRRIAIGSLKSNVGHLDSAAGVAGFIKSVLAVKHGQLPPSLHFRTPNPNIDFESAPFYVNTELRDWPDTGSPRRAGMSSFGIGGTNAHIVVQQPPEPAPRAQGRTEQTIVLSARTPAALDRMTADLADHLDAHPGLDLADVAGTLGTGRGQRPFRRAVVGADAADVAALLRDADPRRVFTGVERAGERTVVFLFSGVGDQYPNMTRGLYEGEPVFRAEIDRCAEVLRGHLGVDLRELLYDDTAPTEAAPADPFRAMLRQRSAGPLDPTRIAQPLLFTTQYALARLWQHYGVHPAAMLGYSIGEYVAACLAGVLSLEDALWFVARRATRIEELPAGAMLAVLRSADEVTPLLSDRLSLAAVDAAALCVVSGPPDDVAALAARLTEDGVATRPVPATHAFHSAMMRPLDAALRADLAGRELHPPRIPFLSNVTGTWITDEEATDPGYWAGHVHRTVRFADEIAEVWRLHAPVVVEMGPGQALGSLVMQHRGRVDGGLVLGALRGARDRQADRPDSRARAEENPDRATLLAGLSRAWVAGVEVDWAAVFADQEAGRVELPTYPFEHGSYWVPVPDRTEATATPAPRRDSGRRADQGDWFYLPSWQQTPAPGVTADPGELDAVLVIADEDTLATQVLAGCAARGARTVLVTPGPGFAEVGAGRYRVDPASPDDWMSLVGALRAAGGVPTRVLHGLAAVPAQPGDRLRPFHSLLFLARALTVGKVVDEVELTVLSAAGLAVSGEADVRPEHGMVAGLCRVIPQELPQVRCRHIDVALPSPGWQRDRLAGWLVAELGGAAGSGVSVAYRGDTRWVQDYVPAPLTDDTPGARLRPGGCYLIVGGLGRIGSVIAHYLADQARACVEVVVRSGSGGQVDELQGGGGAHNGVMGDDDNAADRRLSVASRTDGFDTRPKARIGVIRRTRLPDRADWDAYLATAPADDTAAGDIRTIRALESAGAQVATAAADVADRDGFGAAVAAIERELGALDGVFHVAGIVTAQGLVPLAEATPERCAPHLAAKVHGVDVLADVLAGRELDFVLLSSSIAAVLGGIGFAAYAAANTYLGLVAHQQSQAGPVPWSSLAWEGWTVGDDTALAGSTLREYLIDEAEAAEILTRLLASSLPPQLVNSTGDLAARLDQWVNHTGAADEEGDGSGQAGGGYPWPMLQTAYVAPRDDTERALADIWQQLLGIDQVGVYDSFFELGGHSLLATRVIARLLQELRVQVQLHELLTKPTVADLAEAVRAALAADDPAPVPAITRVDRNRYRLADQAGE